MLEVPRPFLRSCARRCRLTLGEPLVRRASWGIGPVLLTSCALSSPSVDARGPAPHRRDVPAQPASVGAAGRFRVLRTQLQVAEHGWALHLPREVPPPLPGALVLHSARGRTESVLAFCDRLASRGIAALAVDFFEGRVARGSADAMALRDAANQRSERLEELSVLAFEQLQADPRVASRSRFLVGWSYGAAWATYLAPKLPGLNGVIAYYGQAFSEDVERYRGMSAPVLLIGGQSDQQPSPERLRGVQRELLVRGVQVELRFVEAGHGFAERSHPGYREAARLQAERAALEFLDEHL